MNTGSFCQELFGSPDPILMWLMLGVIILNIAFAISYGVATNDSAQTRQSPDE